MRTFLKQSSILGLCACVCVCVCVCLVSLLLVHGNRPPNFRPIFSFSRFTVACQHDVARSSVSVWNSKETFRSVAKTDLARVASYGNIRYRIYVNRRRVLEEEGCNISILSTHTRRPTKFPKATALWTGLRELHAGCCQTVSKLEIWKFAFPRTQRSEKMSERLKSERLDSVEWGKRYQSHVWFRVNANCITQDIRPQHTTPPLDSSDETQHKIRIVLPRGFC